MGSSYLSGLSVEERKELEQRLWNAQQGVCFICEREIDLILHSNTIDIDHVEPIKTGGRDDPSNFALTHSSCNRSKQASDLRVARVLARFERIREECSLENRGPNLTDIFQRYGGAQHMLTVRIENQWAKYSFPELGDNNVYSSPIYVDELSGMSYFFAKLPIAYLWHDDRINPRAIGSSISRLIEEFFKKRPQLHVSLAWMELKDSNNRSYVKVFDGQHKAAAQVLLGVKELPVRIFVNPDLDLLLTTNTNAGTTLRQVAFDKSVQRHLGSALYIDRVERYQKEHNLDSNAFTFSERDLVRHFKGESREMKRYILDAVRDSITHHPDNRLMDFVDFGGRGNEKPLSYSTIEKTFYSFFIFQDLLNTPLDFGMEEGNNPRELEKEQILELMNIVADEIYVGKFDPDIGTYRVENRIQKGEKIPEDHLIACRLSREEIIYNWLKYVQQIIKQYFIYSGLPINEDKLFQYKFPLPLWERIRIFIRNLKQLPLWVNRELSLSVFGGKQNYEYWQTIFETGKSPQNQQVLGAPLNLMEMIKE
ncbi:MAG: HNH endonuclease [Thermodesulfobacteriota bacterium]